ncbi:sensor histidine kinase [Actinoplanes couchii]|uniref:histidine kinase n=1 Tax=Actinoplanes couchii TaxID=403638 RepID=A0ABQ3XDA5_9ACTN|nr:histidine kinase [Actinoplanes couchii]MDR6321338.1 signal transduction histidine kinase [Actinoplanes couchii]GID56448.1 two-component sensor histidine kinase [Actinoplanes couchii]
MDGTRRNMVLIVGAAAGFLLVVTSLLMTSIYNVPLLVSYAAATAQCVALPMALWRPWPALVLQLGGFMTFAWVQPVGTGLWPLPGPVLVLLVAHVGLVGATRPWREAVLTWWGTALAAIVLVLADPRHRPLDDGDLSLVLYATVSVLTLFAVIAWNQRGTARRQLAEAQRDVELEQAQRALVEERNRIARELHDVVAHSMSVIHMQATSAEYRIKDLDPESRAEFVRIAAGTRRALREMRQLLALLREEDAENELQPMPDLEHLADLADSARRGGIPVELAVELDGLDLPDTVGLAAYRIVQESLSNVVRHAPGAPTSVNIAINDGGTELVIDVVNGLPTQAPRPIEDGGGVSHGLVGMRERARLAGGAIRTGARPEGGYRVTARFPLTEEQTAEERTAGEQAAEDQMAEEQSA